MKIFAPDYYAEFKCIADGCKHNCCIGWEIDIDCDTFSVYNKVGGKMGRRLKENIEFDGGAAHFILSENERCPFLNGDNLCDIILNLGEENLCQICADHPRYRNFFPAGEEIGVGLCCEAACRLVLSQKGEFKLIEIADDGNDEAENEFEAEFFDFRQEMFELIKDCNYSLDARVLRLLEMCGADFPEKSFRRWREIFMKLERLDFNWDKKLELIGSFDGFECDEKINTAFENILIYFIYRHTAEGIYDGRIKERVCFAVLSFYIIRSIFANEYDKSFETLAELCRMYSSEIEYCEENIEALLNVF